MAVESADDRAVFVNPDDFGVTTTYGAGAVPLDALLDNEFFAASLGLQVDIEGSRPRIIYRSADLVAAGGAAHGDSLTVLSCPHLPALQGAYKVREIHPDGTGMTELVIERQ